MKYQVNRRVRGLIGELWKLPDEERERQTQVAALQLSQTLSPEGALQLCENIAALRCKREQTDVNCRTSKRHVQWACGLLRAVACSPREREEIYEATLFAGPPEEEEMKDGDESDDAEEEQRNFFLSQSSAFSGEPDETEIQPRPSLLLRSQGGEEDDEDDGGPATPDPLEQRSDSTPRSNEAGLGDTFDEKVVRADLDGISIADKNLLQLLYDVSMSGSLGPILQIVASLDNSNDAVVADLLRTLEVPCTELGQMLLRLSCVHDDLYDAVAKKFNAAASDCATRRSALQVGPGVEEDYECARS